MERCIGKGCLGARIPRRLETAAYMRDKHLWHVSGWMNK